MNWEVQICHSYKEVNACANVLANIACGGGFTLMLYEHCPAQISMLFVTDLVGDCTLRLVRR
jgi:TnpA family transposase